MPKIRDLSAKSFGARLAALRQEAGLTQIEVAQAIGISQRMLSHYEGVEDHSLAKLLRHLALVLDVTTDELLGVTEPKAITRRASRKGPAAISATKPAATKRKRRVRP
jgi:transcriptional regulator with XRE-family HTH domain